MIVVERGNGVREVSLIASAISLVGNGMGMTEGMDRGMVQVALEEINKMNHG